MEKKYKIILCIVFFPITLLFCFLKLLLKIIEKRQVKKYLNKIDIQNLDCLDGYGLEEFLYLFFTHLGLKVSKTKKSRDYGADLIINFHHKKIVIQCKLYYNHSVGNSAIQEIATAKNYYSADKGIVITNSHFTKSAINLSQSSNITLIDRDELKKLLNCDNSQKKYLVNSYFTCD